MYRHLSSSLSLAYYNLAGGRNQWGIHLKCGFLLSNLTEIKKAHGHMWRRAPQKHNIKL